jgi:hypothetical protein
LEKPAKNTRLPILVLGHAPAALSPFACISLTEKSFPSDPDLYFLLCAREEAELRAALEALAQASVPADQIIIARGEGFFSRSVDPFTGILEILPSDSTEELRQRLIARLETQRHRKLTQEIESTRNIGLPSELEAEDWALRLEAAHLTHGFCCAMELSASVHGLALRSALRGESTGPASWPPELSDLLPLCARLALQHWQTPALFREEFRKQASALPFRLRTDLRNVVERCLESVWKGFENAS